MATTDTTRPTPPWRRRAERGFLLTFHAAVSGGFLVAYLTGDEDTYAMHQVAGYTVLAALVLRLLAGLAAAANSPLRLPRLTGAAPRGRTIAWMAAALLAAVGGAALSGAGADFVPRLEHLHETLANAALFVVFAHIGLILARVVPRIGPWIGPRVLSRVRSRFWPGATPGALVFAGMMLAAGVVFAAGDNPARRAILDDYATEAKAQAPSFAGFSAERGRALYAGPHSGGNPETTACAACHTANPAGSGKHYKTGRAIEPMAVSANPARFTDRAQIEKRFERDCPNVLGRACTAQEKGDFITFLAGQ